MIRAEATKISVGDTLKLIKSPANSIWSADGLWLGSGDGFEVAYISDDGYGPRFHAVEPGKKYWGNWGTYSYVTPSEVELVQPAMSTAEKIQATIDAHKAELTAITEKIEKAEAKLAFLQETGSDEFDETEFKAYQTLKLIEENPEMSRLEKAKAIAAIVSAG